VRLKDLSTVIGYPETGSPAKDAVRVVCDGCPELILNLREPFVSASDAQWIPQPTFLRRGSFQYGAAGF
jgi:hypothetical protein